MESKDDTGANWMNIDIWNRTKKRLETCQIFWNDFSLKYYDIKDHQFDKEINCPSIWLVQSLPQMITLI
ncbi:hypothetical protein A4A49_18506 [Nicotiana attenuata]|uniref:Uncharacterized protein n=1 Tax=Nicotiana attenuata TaxID=49451 RepID=A0A314KTE2_NICAT|nr:hypothetical protein A4A49_18506 [Nicotiana attenuata]